jgi:hypothetical protein
MKSALDPIAATQFFFGDSSLPMQTEAPPRQPTKDMNLTLSTVLAILMLATASASGQMGPAQAAHTFAGKPVSYQPITAKQRLHWFARSTVGPKSLTGGLFTAAFGTTIDRPKEYGPHWEGFGKRYGMRLTGIATGNAMEASLGALWGEDPRYFRATGQSFRGRIRNVVLMTFAARRTDGDLAPAFARYAGISGNNFLSNSWRADSESGVGDACLRIGLGFAGRMAGNAFSEFWPSLTDHVFHRNK